MSTLDAKLAAIDARTGNLKWAKEVAPYQSGYSKTAAPLIVKDQVVTGIAGGEYGIRGFLDSYNPETGQIRYLARTLGERGILNGIFSLPLMISMTGTPSRSRSWVTSCMKGKCEKS